MAKLVRRCRGQVGLGAGATLRRAGHIPKHDYHWTFGNKVHVSFPGGGAPANQPNQAFSTIASGSTQLTAFGPQRAAEKLAAVPGGTYHIDIKGICFDACFHGDADACFQFEVCKD